MSLQHVAFARTWSRQKYAHPDAWRPHEDSVLRANYAKIGGPAACLRLLPHRTGAAISRRAHQIECSRDITKQWTPPAVAMLRELWPTGKTASACAAQISKACSVVLTRNSVMGKVHRLGLQFERPTREKKPKTQRVRKPRQRTAPAFDFRTPTTRARQRTTAQVIKLAARQDPDDPGERFAVGYFERKDSQCAWLLGPNDQLITDQRCCGANVCNGENGRLPYCLWHTRLAYQPAVRRVHRSVA